MSKEREPKNTFSPSFIRDVSELVYRARLESDCAGNVARMIANDEDGGVKLRGRAGQYDALTRAYLAVLGYRPMQPNDMPSLSPDPAMAEVEGAPV